MRYVLLASMLAAVAAVSLPAMADGCYIPKPERSRIVEEISEPDQKAVIVHQQGRERLILQVSFKGTASQFAWLVPTPTRPKLAAAAPGIFDDLYQVTASRVQYWLNADQATHFSVESHAGAKGGIEAAPSVRVLERRSVAGYDVSVLKATRADDLLDWLRKNGYQVTDRAAPILAEYIQKDWVFSAARIDTRELNVGGSQSVEGLLQPLQLDFAAKEPVYPLKISSLNPGPTNVLLYVIADHFVAGSPLRTVCALDDRTTDWKHLVRRFQSREVESSMLDSSWYTDPYPRFCITKLSADLDSTQMTGDVLLTPAASQTPVPPPYVSPPFLENLGALAIAVIYIPSVLIVEPLLFTALEWAEPAFTLWGVGGVLLLLIVVAVAVRRRRRARTILAYIGAVVVVPPLILLSIPKDPDNLYEPVGAAALVILILIAALLVRRAVIRRNRAAQA
jgi:hypothetical protein